MLCTVRKLLLKPSAEGSPALSKRVTEEGEVMPYYQTELKVGHGRTGYRGHGTLEYNG